MAVYTRKTCGKCGFVIQPMKKDNDDFEMGNPFSVCPNCLATLVTSRREEFIMFKWTSYIKYFGWRAFGGFFVGLLVGATVSDYGYDMTYIVAGIFSVLFALTKIKRFKEDKEDSLERIKDYDYLNSLYQANLISKDKFDQYKVYCKKKEVVKEKSINITPNNVEEKKVDSKTNDFDIVGFSENVMKLGLKELDKVLNILDEKEIEYDLSKVIASTIAYFSSIWINAHKNSLTVGESYNIEKTIQKKFNKFINNYITDLSPSDSYYINEYFEGIQKKAILSTFEAVKKDGSFVDEGITNEYLLCYLNKDIMEEIKDVFVIIILKDWAGKALKASKTLGDKETAN